MCYLQELKAHEAHIFYLKVLIVHECNQDLNCDTLTIKIRHTHLFPFDNPV